MSNLFDRIAGHVESVVDKFALPELAVGTTGWLHVSTTAFESEIHNGIFRVRRIAPVVSADDAPAYYCANFDFGDVDFKLGLPEHPLFFALVWDRKSLTNILSEVSSGWKLTFGLARPLTPAETIEFLVEESEK